MSAWTSAFTSSLLSDTPEVVTVAAMTASGFELARVAAVLGRSLLEARL